ncbi:MAG: hypothetical protein JSV17_01880 [Candidatus Aminicenantes bacterium]|nr:MAG: hypothetical protein JSV17_01880 [Candidatus Aminicenantes bacterium]
MNAFEIAQGFDYPEYMKVAKTVFFSLLVFFLFSPEIFPHNQQKNASEEKDKREDILKKTADYCEKLKKVVFDFVCHENITEKVFLYDTKRAQMMIEGTGERILMTELEFKRAKTTTYLYDYQMVRKGEEGFEKRILLKENKRNKHQENAQLKLRRFEAKYLIYGPVGFLSKYWQDFFDYKIAGIDTVDGRSALLIEIAPNSHREENYSFGNVWVDMMDYSILKIEWDQRSIKDMKDTVESRAGNLKRAVVWGALYGVEKNGIRFPSRQYIEETFVSPSGRKHTKYTVDIVYDNYKFFIVETEVRIR